MDKDSKNDVKNFRVTVLLNEFFSDHRSVALLYLRDKIKTIADVEEKIAETFSIDNFYLTCNNKLLPSSQDKRILEKDDLVWVHKSSLKLNGSTSSKAQSVCEPEIKKIKSPKKSRRISVQESPPVEESPTEPTKKRKYTKRKTFDEEACNENSPTSKSKKKEKTPCTETNDEPSKQRKKRSKLTKANEEALETVKNGEEILQNSPQSCVENVGEKINISSLVIIPPKGDFNSISSEQNCCEENPQTPSTYKETRKTYFGVGNTVNLLRGSSSGLEVKRKRKRKRVRKSKSCIKEFKPESMTNLVKPIIINKSKEATHIKFEEDNGFALNGSSSFNSELTLKGSCSSSSVFSSSSSESGLASKPLSSCSLYNTNDKGSLLNTNVSTQSPTKNECTSMDSSSLCVNLSNGKVFEQEKPKGSVPFDVIWSRNIASDSNENRNRSETDSVDYICHKGLQIPIKEELILKHPVMRDVHPEKGDIISFKILKITEVCTPEISNYITGVVESIDDDGVINFNLINGVDECITPSNKLLCPDEQTNNIENIFMWSHLVEPRRLFSNSQLNKT